MSPFDTDVLDITISVADDSAALQSKVISQGKTLCARMLAANRRWPTSGLSWRHRPRKANLRSWMRQAFCMGLTPLKHGLDLHSLVKLWTSLQPLPVTWPSYHFDSDHVHCRSLIQHLRRSWLLLALHTGDSSCARDLSCSCKCRQCIRDCESILSYIWRLGLPLQGMVHQKDNAPIWRSMVQPICDRMNDASAASDQSSIEMYPISQNWFAVPQGARMRDSA